MKFLEIIKQIKAIRKEIDKIEKEEYKKIDSMSLKELEAYSNQIKELLNEVKK